MHHSVTSTGYKAGCDAALKDCDRGSSLLTDDVEDKFLSAGQMPYIETFQIVVVDSELAV